MSARFLRATRKSLGSLVLLFGAVAFPSLTAAASVTYNFSYSGVNQFMPNATATGTGFFTISYTGIGPQPPTSLTDFSFLLTLTTNGPQSESSNFNYTLADVGPSPGVILIGTTLAPLPAQIAVVTNAITGTDPVFGAVAVDFNMFPSGGSILTQGFNRLGDTSGSAVWTSIVTVPEPSALALIGIGATLMAACALRLRSSCC